jgi:glycosyltransferase involved in cell wall biosynthesis
MRILFLSNYYPPFARGGYEQWCQEVAEELVRRGNNVSVLTSRISQETSQLLQNGVDVYRTLSLEVEQGLLSTTVRLLRDRKRVENENLDQVHRLVASFKPDVAMVWGMWNIPRSVPALLEQLQPDQVAYYICDYWLTLPNAYVQRWREPATRQEFNIIKRLLARLFLLRLEKEAPVSLELKHPICVSNAVKKLLVDSHPSVRYARVIYGGTNSSEFSGNHSHKFWQKEKQEFKLLYMGRLEAEKGVHTAIQAIPIVYQSLSDELQTNAITLDIIGNGDPVYIEKLRGIVEQNHINDRIRFLKSKPRSEMPKLMAQYDALIFPSEWPEPFARTVLEAMAAGLIVIGTTTGGTGELLVNLETGLTFPAGDAQFLAKQICQVFKSPELGARLAQSGQERIMTSFTFKSMVDQIEGRLCEISQA